MAREIRTFTVTVPPGTLQTAPITVETTFPVRQVRQVSYRFPPGCVGLVGFYLGSRGIPILPLPAGTFATGDGTNGDWAVDNMPDSGDWDVTAYNLGTNPHGIKFTWYLDLTQPPVKRLQLVSNAALSDFPGYDAALYPPGIWG